MERAVLVAIVFLPLTWFYCGLDGRVIEDAVLSVAFYRARFSGLAI